MKQNIMHEVKTADSTPIISSTSADVRITPRLILIVDNNPYSARITSHLFHSLGYSTETAHSMPAALNMLGTGEVLPDLIFMEMLYHNSNIFQFPEQVHSNPLWRNLPIVAHSVPTTKQNVVRAIQSGYCDYILRPTEPDILKEKIDRIFKSSTKVDSPTFALPVSTTGSVSVDIEITAISEFGIEGLTQVPLKENSVIKLNSTFLAQFDLSQSLFRVTGCAEHVESPNPRFKVALSFVGLSAESARLIRQYLIRQASRVLKVA
jgi:CheY-like chemotaxis protein